MILRPSRNKRRGNWPAGLSKLRMVKVELQKAMLKMAVQQRNAPTPRYTRAVHLGHETRSQIS